MSATVFISNPTASPVGPPPPLEPGDHLDQKTFHARYRAMPPGTRAELIGGIVYMPSPMKRAHSRLQRHVSGWLKDYEVLTPGVEGGDSATLILGPDSEPQPDCCLYILPQKGGQIRVSQGDYLAGAPEFVAEIASSTESYDLHSKKRDYHGAGVREYLVVALRQQTVFWFIRGKDTFEPMRPGDDGIFRSQVFAGLWLDPKALLQLDGKRVREVLQQGCATAEHTEFVRKLGNR